MSGSDQALASAPRGDLPNWVVVTALGMLTGLQPVTTDLYLPALPQMQRALGMSPSAMQWTLSVRILAFGIGQLMSGPMADRFGRRPVLRWGLGLYVLAGLMATFANDLGVMILARAMQGLGLSASVVCGRAMIRDLYAPEQGARMMAKGMSVLGMIALAGPILGGLTATYAGWRPYGLAMASISLSYLMGTFLCRRLLPVRGTAGTVRIAGWCSLAGGLAIVGVSALQVALDHAMHAWTLLPGMWVYAFAHATHQSCGQAGVVSAFPTRAGAASALSGFVLSAIAFVIGTVLSWWTAQPGWANTLHPMTLSMGLGGAITAWVALGRVQRDGLVGAEA